MTRHQIKTSDFYSNNNLDFLTEHTIRGKVGTNNANDSFSISSNTIKNLNLNQLGNETNDNIFIFK